MPPCPPLSSYHHLEKTGESGSVICLPIGYLSKRSQRNQYTKIYLAALALLLDLERCRGFPAASGEGLALRREASL